MKIQINLKKFSLLLFLLSLATGCCLWPSKRKEPYVIGKNPASFAAFSLHGAEKNVSGFSDDLLYEIATEEKIQVRLFVSDKRPILSLLKEKDVDGVFSAETPTEQKEINFIFS